MIHPADARAREDVDRVDSWIFTGDWLTAESEREFLRETLARWQRALAAEDELAKLPPEPEEEER